MITPGGGVTGLRIGIALVALLLASWLAFDGAHALITGDFVTPDEGEYAGQLGPWSKLVATVGIDPRSSFMKWIHVLLGVGHIGAILCFAIDRKGSARWMLAFACAQLWYLPFGTILAVIQLGLLSWWWQRTEGKPDVSSP